MSSVSPNNFASPPQKVGRLPPITSSPSPRLEAGLREDRGRGSSRNAVQRAAGSSACSTMASPLLAASGHGRRRSSLLLAGFDDSDPDAELYKNLWKQKWLIPPLGSPHSSRLRLWKYVLLFFASYNAYAIPLQLAFEVPVEQLGDGPDAFRLPVAQLVLLYLLDLTFAVDIAVCFRTMYLPPSEEGSDPVTDLHKISRRYQHGWLALDVFACLPIDWFAAGASDGGLQSLTAQWLRMNRLLQMARLYTTHADEIIHLPRLHRLVVLWMIFLLLAHWVRASAARRPSKALAGPPSARDPPSDGLRLLHRLPAAPAAASEAAPAPTTNTNAAMRPSPAAPPPQLLAPPPPPPPPLLLLPLPPPPRLPGPSQSATDCH